MRTVLLYGDSNTHGTLPMTSLDGARRLGPEERWPGVLAAGLGPGWRVIDEGLGGRTTVHDDPVSGAHKNGLAVLPAVLESHQPIDLVAVMLGTNDLKAQFAMPAVQIARAVERLLRAAFASGAGPDGGPPRLLLIAPPPVLEAGCLAEIYAGGAAKSRQLAAFYAAAAQRTGATYLDAGTVVASSPVDGVHFDGPAHAALGRAVADLIRSL